MGVGDFHVVPEDVGRLVRPGDLDGLPTDFQEVGVLLIFLAEIVPEVLELEADEGLSCEFGQGKGWRGVQGKLLTEMDKLLIQDTDLIGDV